jgi:hypothetical protein
MSFPIEEHIYNVINTFQFANTGPIIFSVRFQAKTNVIPSEQFHHPTGKCSKEAHSIPPYDHDHDGSFNTIRKTDHLGRDNEQG